MPEDTGTNKKHRQTVTLSTVVSILAICGVILPVGGVVLSPFLVQTMSNAMAGEISDQVKQQTMPANNGVKALLQSSIDQLEGERNLLQARKDRSPAKWTDLDAMMLTNVEQRLAKARTALAEFEKQARK